MEGERKESVLKKGRGKKGGSSYSHHLKQAFLTERE